MSLATLGLAADGLRRVCVDRHLRAESVTRLDLYGPQVLDPWVRGVIVAATGLVTTEITPGTQGR